MNKLDVFIDNLQNKIFDEAKQALGEKGFHRWRNPQYNGKMENPDGYAMVAGECGDSMEIFLKFKKNHVSEASYVTNGCASSSICGSFAVELAIGKSPDDIIDITAQRVLKEIGRLPEQDLHCASLAARTVQEALSDYMSSQQKNN